MENGPPSSLTVADRLRILRNHQKAWKALEYNSSHVIPMLKGNVWELYGGVLAQQTSKDSQILEFRQLPSELRGIKEKEWQVRWLGFRIRDFSMDPAQELLVVIEKPPR